MSKTALFNGNQIAYYIAQLLSEQVYLDNTPNLSIIKTNIWDQQPISTRNVNNLISNKPSWVISHSSLSLLFPFLAKNKAPTVIHAAINTQEEDLLMSLPNAVLLCSSTAQEIHNVGIMAHFIAQVTSLPVVHFYDQRLAETITAPLLTTKEELTNMFADRASERAVDVRSAFQMAGMDEPMEYVGHPEAECVFAAMGTCASVIEQTLKEGDKKVGLLKVRLYRPWYHDLVCWPKTVQRVAVIEASQQQQWGPLFLDIVAAKNDEPEVDILSGRYNSIEDVTPNTVMAVVEGLMKNTLEHTFHLSSLLPKKRAILVDDVFTHSNGHKVASQYRYVLDLLQQVFGSRLNLIIAQQGRAELSYGRLVRQIQERTRFFHDMVDTIKQQQLPTDVLRVLSLWVMRVINNRDNRKIEEAADLVIQVWPELEERKWMLYPKSNWLVLSTEDDIVHQALKCKDNINVLMVGKDITKEVGLYAMRCGTAYVSSLSPNTLSGDVLQEAEAYQGPSIVLLVQENPLLYRWNPSWKDPLVLHGQIMEQWDAFLARDNKWSQVAAIEPESFECDLRKRHKELRLKARIDSSRQLLSESEGPPLTVLFGSDHGNAESVAKKIATRAQYQGYKQVTWMAMDDYDVEQLDHASGETHLLVIVCSTAGQGEMPSNARVFWKVLKTLNNTTLLCDFRYAVFGLGDSHYWPRDDDNVRFYNRPSKLLDAKLETLGAARLVPLGLGDDQEEDGFETGLSAWLPGLWKSLGLSAKEEEEPVYTDEQMKIDSGYLRGLIAEELADYSTGSVSEVTEKLLKFHGVCFQKKEEGLENSKSSSDGFSVCVCMPGGVITPKQWLLMDTMADKYTVNKTLALTERQSLQLDGILKKNLRTTVRNINKKALLSTLGMCGDVCHNIMSTNTVSGVHDQVQKLLVEMKDVFAPQTTAYHEIWLDNSMMARSGAMQDSEPIYGPSYLPDKFTIALAVPPSNDVDVYAHDLGLIAILDQTNNIVTGYNVLIGGTQTEEDSSSQSGSSLMLGYVPADKVIDVAKSVVLVQRDYGNRINRNRSRFKHTIDRLGLNFIMKEIEMRSGGVQLEEAKPFAFFQNDTAADGWSKEIDSNNRVWHYFTLFIKNGQVKDTPDFACKTGLRELAKFHKGEFRLTPQRHVMIANVPEEDLEKTIAHLEKYKMAG